eukprot:470610_1
MNVTKLKQMLKPNKCDEMSEDHTSHDSYAEWITLSQEHLIERETALLSKRVEHIQTITNEQMGVLRSTKNRENTRYAIHSDILDLCSFTISSTINGWNGIKLDKTISSTRYNHFREYFKVAKNWWDQRKSTVLGAAFWTPILRDIQKFVADAAGVDTRPLLLILSGLFHDTVRYANTKQQPLIPNGVIKNCDELQTFLFNTHHSLNINLWLNQQIAHEKQLDKMKNRSHKRTGNAKIVAQKVRSTLAELTSSMHHVHRTTAIAPTRAPRVPLQATQGHAMDRRDRTANHMEYNRIIFCLADEFITNMNKNNHNHNQQMQATICLPYAAYHQGSNHYTVSGYRYNPMQFNCCKY